MLYTVSSRDEAHVSRRELQVLLGRGSRSGIDEGIHKLEEQGFLANPRTRSRTRPPQDAFSYVPGKKLRGKCREDWQDLAVALFGKKGICKGLFGRWAFGPRALGFNGMLVLGALRSSKRGLRASEIQRYLGMFITDDQTVRNQLNKAGNEGLVSKDGQIWNISPNFSTALDEYEKKYGAKVREHRVREKHTQERRVFSIALRGGAITPKDEDRLREAGCIRCGKSNEEHQHENNGDDLEMEHFPPRAWLKKWGIRDHLDLNWAICASENNHYGKFVRRVKAPDLDKSIQIVIRHSRDSDRIAIAKLETSIRKFYKAIDDGDDQKAARVAAQAFVLWHGLVHSPAETRVTYLNDLRKSVADGTSRPLQRPAGKPARHSIGQWSKKRHKTASSSQRTVGKRRSRYTL